MVGIKGLSMNAMKICGLKTPTFARVVIGCVFWRGGTIEMFFVADITTYNKRSNRGIMLVHQRNLMCCILFQRIGISCPRLCWFKFCSDLDKIRYANYVFTFVGARISWLSKLQDVVSLSTTKFEYMATIEACKKLYGFKG